MNLFPLSLTFTNYEEKKFFYTIITKGFSPDSKNKHPLLMFLLFYGEGVFLQPSHPPTPPPPRKLLKKKVYLKNSLCPRRSPTNRGNLEKERAQPEIRVWSCFHLKMA